MFLPLTRNRLVNDACRGVGISSGRFYTLVFLHAFGRSGKHYMTFPLPFGRYAYAGCCRADTLCCLFSLITSWTGISTVPCWTTFDLCVRYAGSEAWRLSPLSLSRVRVSAGRSFSCSNTIRRSIRRLPAWLASLRRTSSSRGAESGSAASWHCALAATPSQGRA